MKDQEMTIIGGWLLGNHLEDISRFKPTDFYSYPEVVSIMQTGERDVFNIFKAANIPLDTVSAFTDRYAEAFYMQAVKDLLRRRLTRRLANATPESNVEELVEELEEYRAYGTNITPEPYKDYSMSFIDELEARQKREIVNTGFPSLDRMLCGIRTKELTTIGARPAVGKSAFSLQIALRIASKGNKVLYFPLEMSAMQTLERVAMMMTKIENAKLRSGKLERADWDKLSNVTERLDSIEKSNCFQIYEGVNDFDTIKALVQKEKPYAIVIDQLEQMRARETFNSKRERFSYMTNNLKRLSMTEDIAVLLVAQVGRSVQGGEPTMDNLKESGSIEEDSDNVILLHRYKPDEMSNPSLWNDTTRPVNVKLEKQRSGQTGNFLTVFKADRFKFMEVEKNE